MDRQPPHFHAIYGEYEAVVQIETREVVRGEIPPRALAMVREWASLRRNELRRDPGLFRQARVEGGTLVWPNGADLCPDVVIWGGAPPEDASAPDL